MSDSSGGTKLLLYAALRLVLQPFPLGLVFDLLYFCLTLLRNLETSSMSPHPYFFPKQTSLLPFIIFHERFLLPHYPLCSNLKIRPSSLNIILKAEESSTITSLPVGLILLLMHPNGTSFSLFFLTFALIFSMSFECIIHFKSEVFFIQTILQMLLS